tara:strand:+ start:172 stop:618 length:447 start_codon:yes stop_codon:yes gene_type:complete
MKKILVVLLLSIFYSNNVVAQSMISINKFIEKNSEGSKDVIVQTYVVKRCTAAYLYMVTITKDRDAKTAESFRIAYDKLFQFAAQILMKDLNLDVDAAGENVLTDVDNMMKYYIKDGQDSFVRTGTYVMDNYIGDDLRFCKKLMKSIQ